MLDQVEGVRIHRIDVEQVVLHLADDAPELRQVAPENAVAVHPPQVAVDALTADLNSSMNRLVLRMSRRNSSSIIGCVHRAAGGSWRLRTPYDERVLGQQHEDFQNGEGRALEHVGAG